MCPGVLTMEEFRATGKAVASPLDPGEGPSKNVGKLVLIIALRNLDIRVQCSHYCATAFFSALMMNLMNHQRGVGHR